MTPDKFITTVPSNRFNQALEGGLSAYAAFGSDVTKQQALANLGAGVRPNELDNAYFVGGGTGWGVFPVNQHGASGTISTPGYFIDRWKLVSGTVQITLQGLVLNGVIQQIIPASIGSVYSAVALTTTGLLSCQYNDSSRTFSITGTGQTFVYAKLEKGVGQTAAYQIDGAWNILIQPDISYANQLLRCQQYELVLGSGVGQFSIGSGVINSDGTSADIIIPTPIRMRTMPVGSMQGILYIYDGVSYFTSTEFEIMVFGTSSIMVRFKGFSGGVSKDPVVAIGDFAAQFTLSCPL